MFKIRIKPREFLRIRPGYLAFALSEQVAFSLGVNQVMLRFEPIVTKFIKSEIRFVAAGCCRRYWNDFGPTGLG